MLLQRRRSIAIITAIVVVVGGPRYFFLFSTAALDVGRARTEKKRARQQYVEVLKYSRREGLEKTNDSHTNHTQQLLYSSALEY